MGIISKNYREKIQITIDSISEQYKDLGLRCSAAKCKAMLITGKKGFKAPELKINGELVEYTKVFTYLGVSIHNKLSWETHLENTRVGIIRKLHGARDLLYNDKGLSLEATTWIFKAIIIPKVEFGALAWSSHDLTTKEKNTLTKIARIGFKTQLNMKKSTPTRKLEIITNTAPLHLQAQASALRTWGRVKNLLGQDWDGVTSHVKRRPLAHRAWLEEKFQDITGGGDYNGKGSERVALNKDNTTIDKKFSQRTTMVYYTDASRRRDTTGIGLLKTSLDGSEVEVYQQNMGKLCSCLLYTSPSPRDKRQSRMPSSA